MWPNLERIVAVQIYSPNICVLTIACVNDLLPFGDRATVKLLSTGMSKGSI